MRELWGVFQTALANLQYDQDVRASPFATAPSTGVIFHLFITARLTGVRCSLSLALICISLKITDIEKFSYRFSFLICIPSFEK